MKFSRTSAVGLAISGIAVAAWVSWGAPSRASVRTKEVGRDAPAELGPLLNRLSTELSLVNLRLGRLEESQRQDAPKAPLPSPSSAVGAAAETEDRVPSLPISDGDYTKHAQQVAEVHEHEPVDRAWAPKTESAVRAAIGASLPGVDLQYVECRSTLCRIDIACKDEQAAREAQEVVGGAATSNLLGPGMSRIETDGNGRITTTSYIARQGSRLPPLRQD